MSCQIENFKRIICRDGKCHYEDLLDSYEEWDIWAKKAVVIYLKNINIDISLDEICQKKRLSEIIDLMK